MIFLAFYFASKDLPFHGKCSYLFSVDFLFAGRNTWTNSMS